MKAQDIIALFQAIGRASLAIGIQNSHSGNMACLWRAQGQPEYLVITRTGAQKGDLKSEDIIFFGPKNQKFEQASSELIVHQAILGLQGVRASLHAHSKEMLLMTFLPQKKTEKIISFIPLDSLGMFYLKCIPLISLEKAYGSPELAQAVASKLNHYPVVAVKAHGIFSRGRTLSEAFFYAGLADFSARVVRLLYQIRAQLNNWRQQISKVQPHFFIAPPPYDLNWEKGFSFKENGKLLEEIDQTRNRIFLSQLSPFFTGSFSLREKDKIVYVSPASAPREIGGPLFELSSAPDETRTEEMSWHRLIYDKTRAKAIIRAHIAEAEAVAWDLIGLKKKVVYFEPVEVEGKVLHPLVPVLPPEIEEPAFLESLRKCKVVIVRGGGVWAISHFSLSQALQQISSLKDSCLYYVGLKELGFQKNVS